MALPDYAKEDVERNLARVVDEASKGQWADVNPSTGRCKIEYYFTYKDNDIPVKATFALESSGKDARDGKIIFTQTAPTRFSAPSRDTAPGDGLPVIEAYDFRALVEKLADKAGMRVTPIQEVPFDHQVPGGPNARALVLNGEPIGFLRPTHQAGPMANELIYNGQAIGTQAESGYRVEVTFTDKDKMLPRLDAALKEICAERVADRKPAAVEPRAAGGVARLG